MRRAALLVLVAGAPAYAAPWKVTGEAGAELDTNVQRVETGPTETAPPVAAPVIRFGAHVDHSGRLLGGGYVLALGDLTRIVGDPQVSVENVTMLSGDVRWLHPLGDRPVSAGFALSAIDALPLGDPIGARTFDNLGADALLALHPDDRHRLTLAVGGRKFVYKPAHDYDWIGPAATARLELTLWQPAERTKSLELAATLELQGRSYTSRALVDTCPAGAMPDPKCLAPTDLARRDRYQSAGVELTWVGREVASLGYQLIVIDSNSSGESLARHRVLASGTIQLGKTYATLLAILQIDQYLDGLIVQRDLQHEEFTDIEDENRSSLQLRVARALGASWSIEGRAAIWRNVGGAMELGFARELVYAGVVYTR